MNFQAEQKTFEFKQLNTASIDRVFPLLCPVREKDWIDGWDYNMIYSKSGLIEENCVFSTPHHAEAPTIWHVTKHDKKNHEIEFVRMTLNESVVRINIKLSRITDTSTQTHIKYQYTGLSALQNEFIKNKLEEQFTDSMKWWEKAINYYLETGKMLKK